MNVKQTYSNKIFNGACRKDKIIYKEACIK